MKRARLIWGLTMLLALSVAPVWADDVAQDLQSIVIESFDDPAQRVVSYSGLTEKQDRIWVAEGSKFATDNTTEMRKKQKQDNPDANDGIKYPRYNYFDTWPDALFGSNSDKLPLKSFGINCKFDRKGFNWIEIYPAKKDKDKNGNFVSQPIGLPGIVKKLDFWVWGSNYKYYLELHFRDARGIPFVVDCGDVNFQGWRNISVDIPGSIPQLRTHLPRYQGIELTKIVLRTDPNEDVSGFYIYFDQFKILTDTHQNPFDGRDLIKPEFIDKNWNGGAGSSASSNNSTSTAPAGTAQQGK
jgi:hypothetical protein